MRRLRQRKREKDPFGEWLVPKFYSPEGTPFRSSFCTRASFCSCRILRDIDNFDDFDALISPIPTKETTGSKLDLGPFSISRLTARQFCFPKPHPLITIRSCCAVRWFGLSGQDSILLDYQKGESLVSKLILFLANAFGIVPYESLSSVVKCLGMSFPARLVLGPEYRKQLPALKQGSQTAGSMTVHSCALHGLVHIVLGIYKSPLSYHGSVEYSEMRCEIHGTKLQLFRDLC
ncbi:hypothetical protein KCU76_g101, partial [Aureobasidium melanogenum]